MKIINVWSLHYHKFLIEIEGTKEEAEAFEKRLTSKFDDVTFLIELKGGNTEK